MKLFSNKRWLVASIPIVVYIALVIISSFLIRFDVEDLDLLYDASEYNIKVAKYYFLTLPTASMIPTIAILLFCKLTASKSEDKKGHNKPVCQYNGEAARRCHLMISSTLEHADRAYKVIEHAEDAETLLNGRIMYQNFLEIAASHINRDLESFIESCGSYTYGIVRTKTPNS